MQKTSLRLLGAAALSASLVALLLASPLVRAQSAQDPVQAPPAARVSLPSQAVDTQAAPQAASPGTPQAMPQARGEGPSTESRDVAGQLEELQTEVMLLKARTARAQAQADLEKASGSGLGNRASLPTVKSIYGRDNTLSALLVFDSGGRLEARAGDRVPGGYRVTRIGAGTVSLTKGGREHEIGLRAGSLLPPPTFDEGPVMLPPLPRRPG